MPTRRLFIASSTSIAATLGAGSAQAAVAPVSDGELQRQMLGRLTAELNDATAAATDAGFLTDVFFDRHLPAVAAADVGAIVAFSFGDRPGAAGAGLRTPGPINEAIADAAWQLYRLKPVPVCAQGEVAGVLAARYGLGGTALQTIASPIVSASGSVTQPSLDALAAVAVAMAGGAAALGAVAVVTHRDQAKRAVQACRAHGMDAGTVASATLPEAYDAQATQPAWRRRDLYLLSDITQQLANLRLALIAQYYPQG